MDIKPSNILITQDGKVKLVDFGIAKFLERVSVHCNSTFERSGMNLMTPDFASPEQIRGNSITTASDVYSLGVLLYSLITGRKPFYFGYRPVSKIITIISKTKPIRPSDLISGKTFPSQPGHPEEQFYRESPSRRLYNNINSFRKVLTDDLDRIALKALRLEPESRFHSAYQFAKEIDHYLQRIPLSTQHVTQ